MPARPNRDFAAADLLHELREAKGWSPEQVPHELKARGLEHVCGRTVRRIEGEGVIPRVRVKFALAALHGLEIKDIWGSRQRVVSRRAA
jgi:DNA-binding XRE family transcriptional regulator